MGYNYRAAEILEREKLLAAGSVADITPTDLYQPRSDLYIRNRYLSRIGASVSVERLQTNNDMPILLTPLHSSIAGCT